VIALDRKYTFDSDRFKQILVHADTKQELRSIKIVPTESMNGVISRLLKLYNTPKKTVSIADFKEGS
jgi:hypothetical protein